MQNLAKSAAKEDQMKLVQIQDHEFRQVGLSRKKFAKLISKLQRASENFLRKWGEERGCRISSDNG